MPQHVQLDLPHRPVTFVMLNDDGLDYVAQLVLRDGLAGYENPGPSILAAAIAYDGGAFIDVGANTGLYALMAAASHPDAQVFAFEPLPSIRERLGANVAANPELARRIRVEAFALSDHEGAAVFNEHVNKSGLISTSSTLESLPEKGNEQYRGVDVAVTTLDAYCRNTAVGRVGLIKADVEGHERAFLTGAVETVRSHRPLIMVELLQGADFKWMSAFLVEHHYGDVALRPTEPTQLGRPRFLSDAWNHLFCPNERLWELARLCVHLGLRVR